MRSEAYRKWESTLKFVETADRAEAQVVINDLESKGWSLVALVTLENGRKELAFEPITEHTRLRTLTK